MPMFRIRAEANATLTAMFSGPARAGAPSLFGAIGAESTGESIWIVAMEWPETYKPLSDKPSKELQHLNRFAVDFRAGIGSEPYSEVRASPSDPPDFHCTRGADTIGVEVTQLTLEERVEAGAQFRPLRMAVMGTNRHRFRQLEGHVVYVSFDTLDGRPPAKMGVATLIDALQAFQPPDFDFIEMPEQAPPDAVTPFEGGTLVSARLAGRTGTPFFQMMGWDLVFAQPVTIRQSEAWNLFQRLLSQHDSAGVDELIVSAQAPIVSGVAYPSDAVAAQAVLMEALETAPIARRIQRIFLHVWSTNGIFSLTPGQAGFEQVCGDLPIRVTPV
jgi:hypothetical protein